MCENKLKPQKRSKTLKNKENIADRLSEAMAARNMRATDLSRSARVSTGYLSRILSGDIENPSKHIKAMAEALRVSESWLQYGVGPTERSEELTIKIFEFNDGVINSKGSISVSKKYKGCEAYICNISDEKYVAVVNKKKFGSGLFVINNEHHLTIAIRIDMLSEVKWSVLEDTSSKISPIGKVVSLWEYVEDENS